MDGVGGGRTNSSITATNINYKTNQPTTQPLQNDKKDKKSDMDDIDSDSSFSKSHEQQE
jgi:hypothetical protein